MASTPLAKLALTTLCHYSGKWHIQTSDTLSGCGQSEANGPLEAGAERMARWAAVAPQIRAKAERIGLRAP